MSITTRAQLMSAMLSAQRPEIIKIGAGGQSLQTVLHLSGNITGVLAGTSTTQGVVPDDSTAGFPPIDSFGGLTGYLAQIEVNASPNNGAGYKYSVCDLLFKSGAHNFNATDVLAAQPSYAARIPGADYKSAQIWIECVTSFTGNPTWTITYTNENGTAGQSTTFSSTAAIASGARLIPVPFAPGDNGVQKIESVTCTVATVGTFNVLVMRPLVMNFRLGTPHEQSDSFRIYGPDATGMPVVFDTSALYPIISGDVGTTGVPDWVFVIAKG